MSSTSPNVSTREPLRDREPREPRRDDDEKSLRVLRPRRAAPEAAVRPTRAEIDLSALRGNLRALRRVAGTSRVWAVLKADGYGHGAPAVARTLERAGVDGICVALLEEGLELRSAGIRAPILVMGGYYGDAYEELLAHDLVPVVHHGGHLEALSRALRTRGLSHLAKDRALVHLKVDTGMGRLGVTLDELPDLLEHAAAFPQIAIDGLMTHLACADVAGDEGAASVEAQLGMFDRARALVAQHGVKPRYVHAANTAGLLRGDLSRPSGARFDAVRPGIALFGVAPLSTPDRVSIELRPTLRLRSEVVALRNVAKGHAVGYGSTWRASRDSVIATVPVGYADGLPRAISEREAGGSMLVRGKRIPIVGVLSMDLATIDVTDVPGVRLRDEVVALGTQKGPLGEVTITVEELAKTAGLIPWDVLTSISRRVPRFYREP